MLTNVFLIMRWKFSLNKCGFAFHLFLIMIRNMILLISVFSFEHPKAGEIGTIKRGQLLRIDD